MVISSFQSSTTLAKKLKHESKHNQIVGEEHWNQDPALQQQYSKLQSDREFIGKFTHSNWLYTVQTKF